jgi:hypothetical protein
MITLSFCFQKVEQRRVRGNAPLSKMLNTHISPIVIIPYLNDQVFSKPKQWK